MKVMTVLGTRPEIIRLSRVIPLLDKLSEHTLVHTGQNYDNTLSEIFFAEMGVRKPDVNLYCKSSSAMGQIGSILTQVEKTLKDVKPDRLLLLGDTNSALASIVAKRMGIPVYHMEAGNRCYDDRVPEEVNRRLVDHSSDVLMPYTERSRANLLKEGIDGQRIYVTGNPIYEVLEQYASKIAESGVFSKLSVEPQKYFLITLHRAENVDDEQRLGKFLHAFHLLYKKYGIPLICSLHPRTRSQIKKQKQIISGTGLKAIRPVGLFDFIQLEKNALCVLSDSGTVQEECCIFKIPNVTLRDVTERPETVEAGSNIIAGCEPDRILKAVETVLSLPPSWDPPREYLEKNVSGTVVKILLSQR